uniref:Uncharacterized protein n=1 Tax=uncultured bacterium A1Q1_fos_1134 TaxID=1256543 RepID=L7VY45_9BACT|nr:hypothetical protein [uncultured bacterium A1Q1_fos_1134]
MFYILDRMHGAWPGQCSRARAAPLRWERPPLPRPLPREGKGAPKAIRGVFYILDRMHGAWPGQCSRARAAPPRWERPPSRIAQRFERGGKARSDAGGCSLSHGPQLAILLARRGQAHVQVRRDVRPAAVRRQ